MNKRFLYLLVPLLLFFGSRTTSHAQTTLAAGDIAFVMLNCNSSPQMTWAWVPLVDIASGTTIYFTDNGWNGTGFVYDYATLFSTITSQNDDQITLSHPQNQVKADSNSFAKLSDIKMAQDIILSNKSEILSSPAVAMTAQANQSIEGVLRLLA